MGLPARRVVRPTLAVVALLALGGWAGALLGATALACTNLATISLSSPRGRPGATIALTGSSFQVSRNPALPTVAVVVRWRGDDGPVLGEMVPDRTGTVSATFTVPDERPGVYVIVASQRRAVPDPDPARPPRMLDEFGTPARASFEVVGPNGPLPRAPVADVSVGDGEPSSITLVALTVVFGAIALAIFAGGFAAFVYQARRRNLSVPRSWTQ